MQNIDPIWKSILGRKNYKIVSTALVLIAAIIFLFTSNGKGAQNIAGENVSKNASSQTLVVKRVVDGDTIELSSGEKVRYIGVNTPESVDPRTPVQCFGKEASQRNKDLVEGKEVRLVADVGDKDRYGRLLRYVYVGDTFINLELVREGYAQVDTVPPNIAHKEDFVVAQKEARENQKGLWSSSACNGKLTPAQK